MHGLLLPHQCLAGNPFWELRCGKCLCSTLATRKRNLTLFKGRRVTEYPGLDGTHKDHSNPSPGPAQHNPKNPTCLRGLPKCFFNSGSLGAVESVLYFVFIPNLRNSFSNTGTTGGLACWKCIVRSEQWIIRKQE